MRLTTDQETRQALEEAKQLRAQRQAQQEARLRKLHADGYSDTQIGRIVGLAATTVETWRKAAGLPSNGKGLDL